MYRFENVALATIAHELPAQVVTSRELEDRLADLYRELRIQPGQLEALTGIRERRWWPKGQRLAPMAARAAEKALRQSGVPREEIGLLIYGGVCRDNLEPATACEVAHLLGLGGGLMLYDLSNACLGVMNGVLNAAIAVEQGLTRAALVVSCETARQIVDLAIERMLTQRTMEEYRVNLATLTGGSGAIAVLVTDARLTSAGPAGRAAHRLLGGVLQSRPQHHALSVWGPDTGHPATGDVVPQSSNEGGPLSSNEGRRQRPSLLDSATRAPMAMNTDAAGVLQHGVALGIETWSEFLRAMEWRRQDVDRTIGHQVGAPHRQTILKALGIPPETDFVTYEFLGNIGTVSLPITAALAEQRGVLQPGHHVAFMGIGSGLNCLIIGVRW